MLDLAISFTIGALIVLGAILAATDETGAARIIPIRNFRVGGIRFIKIGRYNFSFSKSRR